MQMLGEVPEEIRVTPERDERLLAQAGALAATDAVRLLDLVSEALDATANGAQARIQLELVLVKAAAPAVDPVGGGAARPDRAVGGGARRRAARADTRARSGSGRGSGGDRTESPAAGEDAATPGAGPAPAGAEPPAPAAAQPPAPEPPPAAEPPSPAPATTPSDGPPELATVAACWPAVIDVVRQANQLLGALLVDARPVSLEGSEVTLAFPKSKAFAQRKAQQDDYRRATAEALRSVVGAPLNLRYELRDLAESEDAPGGAAAAEPGLSQEELVRRLVDEFDAQEVLDDPDQET